jgi:UrcA family protein
MNNVIKTQSKLAKFVVAASFFAFGCAAIDGGAQAAETRSAKVTFAGLDLSTSDGVNAARERLRDTAGRLCSLVADELDLSHHDNYVKCVDDAMARAMPRLEELARKNVPPRSLAGNLSN